MLKSLGSLGTIKEVLYFHIIIKIAVGVVFIMCVQDKTQEKKNGSTFFLRPYSGSAPKLDFGGKYSREDTAVINAEEGKLLVWPNYIYHGSHPYEGKEDRMIISANFTVDLDNNK